MLDLIFMLLLGAILLVVFSRTVRLWLLTQLFGYVQRRVERRFSQSGDGSARGSSRQGERASSQPREKMDMDEIAAKRFERTDNSEYVDFEELPK